MDNLIIQTAFLGDLVLAIPLMRQTANLFPDDRLVVVCRKGLAGALLDLQFIDEIIEVDKSSPREWKRQKGELAKRSWRHVICPHQSPRTAFLVRGLKASGRRVGFRAWWNKFAFDERVERPNYLPDALRQLSLLTAIHPRFAEEYSEISQRGDLVNESEVAEMVDFRTVDIPVWAALNTEDRPGVPRAADESKTIYLAPGSTWPTKQWTLSGYKDLARQLTSEGYLVEVVGAANERYLGEEIQKEVPEVVVRAGEWKLPDTIRAFRQGRLLVANDSGAIHLAALAGLPTVSVFGPTTLALGFRPWQRRALVVQKNLKCRPCGRHGHKKCPVGTHECMTGLEARRVIQAAHQLIRHH